MTKFLRDVFSGASMAGRDASFPSSQDDAQLTALDQVSNAQSQPPQAPPAQTPQTSQSQPQPQVQPPRALPPQQGAPQPPQAISQHKKSFSRDDDAADPQRKPAAKQPRGWNDQCGKLESLVHNVGIDDDEEWHYLQAVADDATAGMSWLIMYSRDTKNNFKLECTVCRTPFDAPPLYEHGLICARGSKKAPRITHAGTGVPALILGAFQKYERVAEPLLMPVQPYAQFKEMLARGTVRVGDVGWCEEEIEFDIKGVSQTKSEGLRVVLKWKPEWGTPLSFGFFLKQRKFPSDPLPQADRFPFRFEAANPQSFPNRLTMAKFCLCVDSFLGSKVLELKEYSNRFTRLRAFKGDVELPES
jgi:hypothetical protein